MQSFEIFVPLPSVSSLGYLCLLGKAHLGQGNHLLPAVTKWLITNLCTVETGARETVGSDLAKGSFSPQNHSTEKLQPGCCPRSSDNLSLIIHTGLICSSMAPERVCEGALYVLFSQRMHLVGWKITEIGKKLALDDESLERTKSSSIFFQERWFMLYQWVSLITALLLKTEEIKFWRRLGTTKPCFWPRMPFMSLAFGDVGLGTGFLRELYVAVRPVQVIIVGKGGVEAHK